MVRLYSSTGVSLGTLTLMLQNKFVFLISLIFNSISSITGSYAVEMYTKILSIISTLNLIVLKIMIKEMIFMRIFQ